MAADGGTVTGLTQRAYCACHAKTSWHLPSFSQVPLATRNLVPATKLVHEAPRACRQQRIFVTPKKCLRKHMQHTCNTRATHVQHTCNTTCNRSIFAANSYDFRSTVQNFLLFLLKWPWDAESGQKAILIGNLQEKWSCCSLCCTSVARLLHVCCMEISNQSCAPHENLSGYLIETQKTENHRTVRDMPAQSGSRVSFSSLLRSFRPNGSAGHDASLGRH